jgi:hypothetical protein
MSRTFGLRAALNKVSLRQARTWLNVYIWLDTIATAPRWAATKAACSTQARTQIED